MANIFVDLVLNNRDFNRGMDQSQKKSKNFQQSLTRIGSVAATAAKAVGAIGVAVAGLTMRQAALAGTLVDTADKIGVSTKFLQEFRFAAVQSGASIQAADMGLQRFTRRMAEAANGTGEARQTLRELGIDVRDSSGRIRDAESVLMDVADAFATSTNQSEMLAQAFKLFDSEGVVLINVLRNGSEAMRQFAKEAEDAGIILSEMDARTLKSLDDSFVTMRFSISALADQVAVGLAEAFQVSNASIIDFVANNRDAARAIGETLGNALIRINEGIKVFMDLIQNEAVQALLLLPVSMKVSSAAGAVLVGTFKALGAAAAGLTTPIATIGKVILTLGRFATIPGLILTAITALIGFRNTTVQLGETTTSVGEIVRAAFIVGVEAVGTFVQTAVAWFTEFRDRVLERLNSFIDNNRETFEKITGFAKRAVNFLIGIFVAGIKNIITLFKLLPGALKSVFDSMIDLAQLFGGSLIDILKAAFSGDLEGVKEVFRNFGTEAGDILVEGVVDPIKNIGSELAQNVQESIGTDYLANIIAFIGEKAGVAKEKLEQMVLTVREMDLASEKAAESAKDLADETGKIAEAPLTNFDQFVKGWQNAGREFLEETENFTKLGGEMFKKFSDGLTESITNFVMTGKLSFKSFLSDIFRMIVQSGIQRALANIFGALGGGGGILGTLFAPFAGGKMLGGMIPAGQFGLVGERGPEFISGPAQITPIRQSDMRGSEAQVVNYNISAVDARSFRELVARDPEFIHAVASTGARRLPR